LELGSQPLLHEKVDAAGADRRRIDTRARRSRQALFGHSADAPTSPRRVQTTITGHECRNGEGAIAATNET
jgi:hypothetical protein